MDRDVVNALHALYHSGRVPAGQLLSQLWCGPDSEPDLDDLTDRQGDTVALNPHLIKFIKATEKQLSTMPRPDFVFSFPFSKPPRKKGDVRPAFVAMPYGPEWFEDVRTVILSAAAFSGFAAEISKDLAAPGLITDQIWQGIRSAEVVVAEVTGGNPNVFYELGLAHALGKEVIILVQGVAPLPFDISTARILRYDRPALNALESLLRQAFASVSPRYAYEGPQPRF